VTPAFALAMPPAQQRVLALALLVVAVAVVLAAVLTPVLLLHRHYDSAIASFSDRLDRYRKVAAQAPELRRALEAIREKNGRRFFLRNTAANLAGAEAQEFVKGAIEANGGRITTLQSQAPKDDGRFRQIGVTVQFFATTPALAKILQAVESQQPYFVVDHLTVRPLNAFRGFKPQPGQEPELNVQMDAVAWAIGEAGKPADAEKK
jgi:hypothetical protein